MLWPKKFRNASHVFAMPNCVASTPTLRIIGHCLRRVSDTSTMPRLRWSHFNPLCRAKPWSMICKGARRMKKTRDVDGAGLQPSPLRFNLGLTSWAAPCQSGCCQLSLRPRLSFSCLPFRVEKILPPLPHAPLRSSRSLFDACRTNPNKTPFARYPQEPTSPR